ncbi:ABC-2 transporter permease [Clostridium malenominatum]
MFNLVFKDFLLQRKITFIAIAYSLFMLVIGILAPIDNPMPLYTFGIIIMVYSSIQDMVGKEERCKSSLILGSLPIDRNDLVISKYLSLIFMTIMNLVMFLLPFSIFRWIRGGSPIPFTDYIIMIVCVSAILLSFSIYFPLYFKFGYAVMRIFPLVIYIGGLMLPGFLQKLIKRDNPMVKNILSIIIHNPSKVLIIFFMFSLAMLLISMFISLVIYKNRDL